MDLYFGQLESHISKHIFHFFQFVLIATLIYPLTIKYGISGTAASITIPLLLSSLFSFYFVKRELKLEIINVVSYILPLILSTIFLILVVLLSQIYLGYIVSIYSLILSFILLFFLYFASALIFDYFGKKRIIKLILYVKNYLQT